MDDFPFNDTPSLLKEIERLKAKVERLETERDELMEISISWSLRCLVFEAKIQRLETALKQCVYESRALDAEIPIGRIVENALDLKHEVDDE